MHNVYEGQHKQKRLSQTEQGNLADFHYIYIGQFKRGTSLFGSDKLKRIAAALDMASNYQLEGTPNEEVKIRIVDHELLKIFQEIGQLSAEDKAVIKTF